MPVDLLQHIILKSLYTKIERFAPSEELRPYIDNFFVFPCREVTASLAYNDGTPMFAFLPERNNEVKIISNGQSAIFRSGWFSTRSFSKMDIQIPSSIAYLLIVRFKVTSFYQLWDCDAKTFTTRPFWSLLAILGNNDRLLKNVEEQKNVQQKIAALEKYIRQIAFPVTTGTTILEEAVLYIQQHQGKISVKQLQERLGVNYKWLERSFSHKIGIPPKTYANLQRFINAYTQFVKGEKDLLYIVADYGYYDTNHFIKDFKKFVGDPPMRYLSRQSGCLL